MNTSEQKLIEQAKAGDTRAFDALYHLHKGAIIQASCKYRIPGMEKADVEQLAAIGFVNAVHTFHFGKVKFISYLMVCVFNALNNAVRNTRRKCREVDNWVISIEEVAIKTNTTNSLTVGDRLRSPLPDPQQSVVFEDTIYQFRKMLTPEQNQFVTDLLRGYTISEIGRINGMIRQSADRKKDSILRKAERFRSQYEQEASHV